MNSSNAPLSEMNKNANNQPVVRKRTRATAEQLAILEDTFAVNVSPNGKLRKQLAERLKMNERSIQIWFQNRRAKVKHMQKRAHMQMHQAAMRAQFYPYSNAYHCPPQYIFKEPSVDYDYPKASRMSFPTPEPTLNYGHPDNWFPRHTSPVVNYQHHSFEHEFLRLDHGPISPSATPDDENSLSPTIKHSKIQKCFSLPPTLQPGFDMKPDILPPTLFQESTNMWTPTPEAYPYYTPSALPYYASAVPSNSTMNPNDLQKDGLDVTTLIIGAWQRMKYPGSDVTCCFEKDKFTWYIEEGGHRFKIEIPLTHVTKIEYAMDVYVHLSQPPFFFMKSDTQSWIQCSDFTENKQASHSLCHILKGPQLQQELFHLISEYPHLSKITTNVTRDNNPIIC